MRGDAFEMSTWQMKRKHRGGHEATGTNDEELANGGNLTVERYMCGKYTTEEVSVSKTRNLGAIGLPRRFHRASRSRENWSRRNIELPHRNRAVDRKTVESDMILLGVAETSSQTHNMNGGEAKASKA
jgi:hypothetical protein